MKDVSAGWSVAWTPLRLFSPHLRLKLNKCYLKHGGSSATSNEPEQHLFYLLSGLRQHPQPRWALREGSAVRRITAGQPAAFACVVA